MSTEEEYKELSAKLRYGLELAEQRLIEKTARREGTLCYGRPDGKVVRISATELLKLRQSSETMRHLWLCVLALRWRVAGIVENRMNNCICIGKNQNLFPMFLVRYSKPRCGYISLLYARIARGKNILIYFVSSKKAVPLQADYYQKFIKRLILMRVNSSLSGNG